MSVEKPEEAKEEATKKRKKTLNEANKKLQINIQYSFFGKESFEPSDEEMKKMLYPNITSAHFVRAKPFEYLKATSGRIKNAIIDTLESEVSPCWDNWQFKPKEVKGLFDESITRQIYGSFIKYTLKKVNVTIVMQKAQYAILRLAKTSPEVFEKYWVYQPNPRIINCNIAYLWLEINDKIGSYWKIKYPSQLPTRLQTATQLDKNKYETRQSKGGTFLNIKGNRNQGPPSPMDVTKLERREFCTFVTLISSTVSESESKAKNNFLGELNHVVSLCATAHKNFVIYPFPREEMDIHKKLTVYSAKNLLKHTYRSSKHKKIKEWHQLSDYCLTLPWLRENKNGSMIMLIGHDKPFQEWANDHAFIENMKKARVSLHANNIQYYETIIIGWLVCAHTPTMDFHEMSKSLAHNPLFENVPIECKLVEYKPYPTYKAPKGMRKLFVAGILTAKDKEKKHIQSADKRCKYVFNKKTLLAAKNRPQGANLKYINYPGSSGGILIPTRSLSSIREAITKHKKYMDICVTVEFPSIQDINATILYQDNYISLLQVLSCLRTQNHWECPMFSQVHYGKKAGEYIGICHPTESQEAMLIAQNLASLCIEKFGIDAKVWFTYEANQQFEDVKLDKKTNKLIDNSICEYKDIVKPINARLSDAQRMRLEETGDQEAIKETLESDDENEYYSDEDQGNEYNFEKENAEFEQEYEFNLDLLFNLEPPSTRQGVYQCDKSLDTLATGATEIEPLATNS